MLVNKLPPILLTLLLLTFSLIFLTFQNKNSVQGVEIPNSGFVTNSQGKLYLNGEEFRSIGVNRYNLLTIGGSPFIGCGSSWTEEQLASYFAELESLGLTTLRFWVFQEFTQSGADFSRLDYVLELTRQHNIMLIPVMENQWDDCTEGGYKYNSWYKEGFKSPYGTYPVSFKDYVGLIVSRYKDNPGILAWQLINEAESKDINNVEDPASLYDFASEMSSYIKSLDPNHLVSLGTMGGGQPGQRNGNYIKLHSLASLDLLEAHDFNKATEALPGAPLRSKVSVKLYIQDKNSTWITLGNTYKTILGDWTLFTSSIPSSAILPLKKIGLHLKNDSNWAGQLNIDAISIGTNLYSFEDGTLQGWQFEGSALSGIKNITNLAKDGTHSLEASLSGVINSAKIYTLAPVDTGIGTTVSLFVFTPQDAPLSSNNSLAADLRIAQDLGKPLFVGEAGIKVNCTSSNCYTPTQRAEYFKAKMNAFFQNNGGLYLIWSYRDAKGEIKDYQFDSNDPLMPVISEIINTYIK